MTEKYIISETEEHQRNVLKLLEELSYLWKFSKKKPTEQVPLEKDRKEHPLYRDSVIYLDEDKKLTCSDIVHLRRHEKDAIETSYEELSRQKHKVLV